MARTAGAIHDRGQTLHHHRGKGFLGRHLIRAFEEHGCRRLTVADLPEYNLVSLTDVRRLYEETKPDIVVHLAAKVGGTGSIGTTGVPFL
jgi:nucleoside-diphosphate-sugar epimerase